jgi:ribosomal protein L44E
MELGEGERDPVTIVTGRDRLDPRKRAHDPRERKPGKDPMSREPREVRSSMSGGQREIRRTSGGFGRNRNPEPTKP